MNIETIKKGSGLIALLEDMERDLSHLKRSDGIDYIEIRRYQSGAHATSYEVRFSEKDFKEMNQMIKVLMEASLKSKIEKLKEEIEKL